MEQQDGSADLFANFAGVMMLVVVVLMMSVNTKESLIDIQNNSAPRQTKQSNIDPRQLALLEVAYQKNGSTRFYWQKDSKAKKQMFASYEEARKAFITLRPDGIRLRMDDRVSSGVYKKILADAANLDIAIYQSDKPESNNGGEHVFERNSNHERFTLAKAYGPAPHSLLASASCPAIPTETA